MMEVGSPSLQNVSRARHIEQMFSPEARSPPVDTGLSLGVPAGNRKGSSMSPQGTGLFPPESNMPVPLSNTIGGYATTLSGSLVRDEALPKSSSCRVAGNETLTMWPLGTVDGNQTKSPSPPDNGLPPSIPSAAYWTIPTTPQNLLAEASLPNAGSAQEFDKGALRDAGSENVAIPLTAAPLHTEAMRVDVDDHQLDMATQPSYLGESQPSQADFNNMHSGGETQLVQDSQAVEVVETQPAFAGETQPVNGDESFDDMVILQNNTFTSSAPPLTNAGQNVSHEALQGTGAQPLQDSFNVPTSTLSDNIPASYLTNVVPTVNKHSELSPAETAGQLGPAEGKEEKDTITSEPQPGLLDENMNGENKTDEGKSQDDVAELGIKDDISENAKIVSEQGIQAIKGRKVVKKFGRKNFEGEVVSYDAENHWFKVVYEDGDEEDLELLEVKEILLNADASSNASTAKRKRKQKGTPKKKGLATGAQKKSRQVKSPPGSKTKGSKSKAKSKGSAASAHESLMASQQTSGAKRKRISDAEVTASSKLELKNVGGKENSKEKKHSSDAKMPRKSSAKKERGKAMAKKNSAKEKGTRHRNLPKLPVVESEVETAVGAGEGVVVERKDKRRKIDASKDQGSLVGKAVKKDFGGTLYRGVVAKFDKKTKYYKVEYEDGDREDLELEELKAVLVH